MTLARKRLICLEAPLLPLRTPGVRRAFLYGRDPLTERSYEHRREWAIELLQYKIGPYWIAPRADVYELYRSQFHSDRDCRHAGKL